MTTVASPDIMAVATSPDSNRAVLEQSLVLPGPGRADEGSSIGGGELERDSQEVGRETIREPLMYHDVCPNFFHYILRKLASGVIADVLALISSASMHWLRGAIRRPSLLCCKRTLR